MTDAIRQFLQTGNSEDIRVALIQHGSAMQIDDTITASSSLQDIRPQSAHQKPQNIANFELDVKEVLLDDLSVDDILKLLALVLDLVDIHTFVTVVEFAIQIVPIKSAMPIFDFLEKHVSHSQHSQSTRLILMRLCKDLFKRLFNAEQKGRVAMFLASVLPFADRSGVNLAGLTNTTLHSPSDDKFWDAQKYIIDPHGSLINLVGQEWTDAYQAMSKSVEYCLDQVTTPEAAVLEDHFQLIYGSVVDVQIDGMIFQLSIIIQCLTFLRYIRGHYKERKTVIQWIDKVALSTLSKLSKYGSHTEEFIRAVFKHEDVWLQWKLDGFPSMDKPRVELFPLHVEPVKPYKPKLNLGTRELHQLWRPTTEITEFQEPTLQEFLEPLKVQLDPEEGIEEEYRLSNDPVYCWRAMRLMLKQGSLKKVYNKNRYEIEQLIDME